MKTVAILEEKNITAELADVKMKEAFKLVCDIRDGVKDGDDKNMVISIQRTLFTVCSYLATDTTQTKLAPSYTIDPQEVTVLEEEIDHLNGSLPRQTSFIIPGGSHEAALAVDHKVAVVVGRNHQLLVHTVLDGAEVAVGDGVLGEYRAGNHIVVDRDHEHAATCRCAGSA